MITHMIQIHPVTRDNHIAQHLYTSMSFISENLTNSDDEVIYRLKIR
jgi:diamine N-acetyltransferase